METCLILKPKDKTHTCFVCWSHPNCQHKIEYDLNKDTTVLPSDFSMVVIYALEIVCPNEYNKIIKFVMSCGYRYVGKDIAYMYFVNVEVQGNYEFFSYHVKPTTESIMLTGLSPLYISGGTKYALSEIGDRQCVFRCYRGDGLQDVSDPLKNNFEFKRMVCSCDNDSPVNIYSDKCDFYLMYKKKMTKRAVHNNNNFLLSNQ